MASPDTPSQNAIAPRPLVPLPPLLAAFLTSRVNPGTADNVAAAVLRVAAEKYTPASAKGKTE